MSRPEDFKFDPYNGLQWASSVPIQVETYRSLYPKRVWWHNPWTGVGRSARDVNDNPFMENVAPPRAPAAAPVDECCAAEGLGAIKYMSSEAAFDNEIRKGQFMAAFQKGAEPAKHDPVDHPKHYTSHPSGVECIQVTEHMGFNLGNALKYIWRADLKANAVEDLKKAVWYIQRELEKRARGS